MIKAWLLLVLLTTACVHAGPDAGPIDAANQYIEQGIAKRGLGQLDEAIALYGKAIQANPKNAYAYYNRALAKRAKGDHVGAVDDNTKALAINPLDPDAFFNRGNAHFDLGRYHEAVADYDNAHALTPTDRALAGRAHAKLMLGDDSGAVQDATKAIEMNPKASGAYNTRALAKERLGEGMAAKADFAASARLTGAGRTDRANVEFDNFFGKYDATTKQADQQGCDAKLIPKCISLYEHLTAAEQLAPLGRKVWKAICEHPDYRCFDLAAGGYSKAKWDALQKQGFSVVTTRTVVSNAGMAGFTILAKKSPTP